MNSKAKGCRGELEAAAALTTEGFAARRGQQFAGGTDSPDVVCPDLPTVHIEVKRTERGNPYDWMAQARRDAGDKLPIVMHRRNDHPWIVVMDFTDWCALVRETDLPRK